MTSEQTEKKTTTKRKMLTLAELKALKLPVRKHLIMPWLKEGESAMVYAPTGVGKSMFAMTLALAVASGGEAFGWSCPEPRRVLYIDGEMHVADLQERALLLLETVEGKPDMAAMDKNLKLFARQYQDSSDFLDLATEEKQKDLLDVLDEEGPVDLLILDNLSTLATIADENAASSFDPILKLLMELKRRGVATILVHHAGKSRTRNDFRGSSKLATTFEVIMGLKQLDETQLAGSGTGFTIQWDKYRQKPDERVGLMDVRLDTSAPGFPRWVVAEAEDAELLKLVAAVKTCQYPTDDVLREKLYPQLRHKSQMSKLKQRAIETKLIDRAHWVACMKEAKEAFAAPSPPNDDF